ncbi:MAG: hypothetical protein WA061_07035 [Microgenomates group bacterium]
MNERICVSKKNTYFGLFVLIILLFILLTQFILNNKQANTSRAASSNTSVPALNGPMCYSQKQQMCMYPSYETSKENKKNISALSLILKGDDKKTLEDILANEGSTDGDQLGIVNYYWIDDVQKHEIIAQYSLKEIKDMGNLNFWYKLDSKLNIKTILENNDNSFEMFYVPSSELQTQTNQGCSDIQDKFPSSCVTMQGTNY